MNSLKSTYGKVCNAGVDYLAFTMLLNNTAAPGLIARWDTLQHEATLRGEERKKAKHQGYEGFATPHLFYGTRHDSHWFRASSDIATQMAVEVLSEKCKINPTRIDLQVTVLADEPWPQFAEHMRQLVRANEVETNRRDRATVRLWESANKGDTCKIGSTDSTRQFMGYDKTAEQKHKIPGQQYRFELKLTAQQAREVWKQLRNAVDMRWIALSFVAGYLLEHGLYVPWTDDTDAISLPSTYSPTNDERRFNWFESQVIPAWWKFQSDEYKARILTAMGLPDSTIIPDRMPEG